MTNYVADGHIDTIEHQNEIMQVRQMREQHPMEAAKFTVLWMKSVSYTHLVASTIAGNVMTASVTYGT